MDRNDQAWAVFRCQLLAPVLLGEVSASQRGAYFRKLSEQEHLLPNGTRKKLSQRTLRRWWKRLREGGVEATQRKRRSDRGQPWCVEDFEEKDQLVSERITNVFVEHP